MFHTFLNKEALQIYVDKYQLICILKSNIHIFPIIHVLLCRKVNTFKIKSNNMFSTLVLLDLVQLHVKCSRGVTWSIGGKFKYVHVCQFDR
jgi:hypothetical protein